MLSKVLLVTAMLLIPNFLLAKKAAPTEMEARGEGIVVRIAGDKCTYKKVLEQIEPQFHKDFRKAEVIANGKPKKACWIVDANGVFVMAEDGDRGYVPLEVFKPVETL